eukprot:jgi/Botrbrau1/17692/Bobra.0166s0116.1
MVDKLAAGVDKWTDKIAKDLRYAGDKLIGQISVPLRQLERDNPNRMKELNLPLYKAGKGAGHGMTPGQQVVWGGEDPELSDNSSTASDFDLESRSTSSSLTGGRESILSGSMSMGNRVVGSVRVAVRYVPEYRNEDDGVLGPSDTASVSSMESHLTSSALSGMQARITRLQNSDSAKAHNFGNLPGPDPHATFTRVLALLWNHWKNHPHASDVLMNKPLPTLPVLQAGLSLGPRQPSGQATSRHQTPALASGAMGGPVDPRRQSAAPLVPHVPAVQDRGIGRSRLQSDSSQNGVDDEGEGWQDVGEVGLSGLTQLDETGVLIPGDRWLYILRALAELLRIRPLEQHLEVIRLLVNTWNVKEPDLATLGLLARLLEPVAVAARENVLTLLEQDTLQTVSRSIVWRCLQSLEHYDTAFTPSDSVNGLRTLLHLLGLIVRWDSDVGPLVGPLQVHLRRAARRQVEESMQPPRHQALTRGRQLHLLGAALQSAAEATEVDLVLQEAFPSAVHLPLVTARVRYANLAALLRQFFFTGDVLPYGEELHQLETALLNLHSLLLDEGLASADKLYDPSKRHPLESSQTWDDDLIQLIDLDALFLPSIEATIQALGPAAVEWLDRTIQSADSSKVWQPVSRTTNALYAACVVDLYLILGSVVDGVLTKALHSEARSVRFRNHLGTLVQATMAPAPLRFAALVEAECLAELCPPRPAAPPQLSTNSPITTAIEMFASTAAATAAAASTGMAALYRSGAPYENGRPGEGGGEAALREPGAPAGPPGGPGAQSTPLQSRPRSMWNALVTMGANMAVPQHPWRRRWGQGRLRKSRG